jgi:hypothetical protein
MAEGLRSHRYTELAARHFDRDLLQMYLEQCLYLELLDVARALVRRRYLALTGRASDKPVTCPSELFDLVSEHWPEKTVRLRKKKLIDIRRRLAPIWHSVRNRLWRSRSRSYAPDFQRPMVGVELVEGSDPAKKCDAFWLANRAVDPARVLFVLEPMNSVFFDAAVEFDSICALGANMVALHPSVSLDGKIPLWFPAQKPDWVPELKSSLRRPTSGLERWLRRALIVCAERVGYWQSFFSDHGVAIIQQFTEATPETSFKRIAICKLGGIEVGKMRSQFFDVSSAAFFFQHDAAFVWHANVMEYLKFGRTRTREIIETGYVYDYLSQEKNAESRQIRTRLEKAGARIVIVVYDNHTHNNNHFNVGQLEAFYGRLVDLTRNNREVGLIVKSKKPHILQMIPKIAADLAELEKSGRCIMTCKAMTTISTSALAADIAVGIPASTAVCEAALCGCRILMYDPGGCRDHPFSGNEKGIIFQQLESFMTALEDYLSAPETSHVGDASAYIPEIDRFRDGMSHRRAADFIRTFLEAKERGLNKLESLDETLRQLNYCYPVHE